MVCGSGGPVLPPWVSSDGDGPHGGVQVRTETACRDPPGPTFRVLQGRLLAEGQGLAGTTGGALTPARGPGEDAAVPSRTGRSPGSGWVAGLGPPTPVSVVGAGGQGPRAPQ